MEKNNYSHHHNISASSMAATSTATATATSGKTKIWEETAATQPQDAGVDELLAVLGYKVRSSDMAEVAQKLEQLEMVMGNAQEDGFGLLSHLSSETVHYNPSDLSTWLESMLSEINPSTDFVVDASSSDSTILAGAGGANDPFLAPAESSTVTTIDFTRRSCSNINNKIYEEPSSSNYDLSAIPGEVVYGGEREKKRLKQEEVVTSVSVSVPDSSSSSVGPRVLTESTRPVVLVDSQETGIRLVHTLMACAEAVQQDKFNLADALLKQIGLLAVSQAGAMRKVAMYFTDALARRVYRLYPTPSPDSSLSDVLQMHFYDSCPYLKFAHFTANQAILEAFAGKTRVHVIDFGLKQGTQWPSLIQALAIRPEGPPVFRLTGIGPPQLDNSDPLQQVGWKLARFAETLRVEFEFEFEFRGFVANSLADLDASMLEIRPGETVAVNSVFELHQLLARPGAIQKVFGLIKETRPTIVTVVEQEANHNGPVFLDRFTEALHYYSTLFDSLEGCSGSGSATGSDSGSAQDLVMTEMYLGQQISNVVACEGVDRVERHETLAQWRNRFSSAGFVPVPLGSNGFKQASALLSFYGGGADGFKVEENQGCLTLGWYTRPLIATSAWQLAPKNQN